LFEAPSEREMTYISFLFRMIAAIFPYTLYDKEPIVVIQKNAKIKCSPLLFAKRIYGKKKKGSRRYEIEKIVMTHEDFEKGKCIDTLLKVADILIHTYGTTKNPKVNVFLTYFGAACVKNRKILSECAEVWDAGDDIQLV